MRDGLKVDHEWSEFKTFSLQVLGNVIPESKSLLPVKMVFKIHCTKYSSKTNC